MELLLLLIAGGAYWYWRRNGSNHSESSDPSPSSGSPSDGSYATLDIEDRGDGRYAIKSFDPFFYAPATVSENGEHIAAFVDVGPDGRTGSEMLFLNRGGVMLFLAGSEEVQWKHQMPRAHPGGVANTGHVAAADWMKGGGLRGEFYVFSPGGDVLIKERFNANLQQSGISADGSIAWCTTANSRNKDSNRLAVYDVEAGELLFRRDQLHGQPDLVKASDGGVQVETDIGVPYLLRNDGSTKNAEEVAEKIYHIKLEADDERVVFDAVEERLSQVDFLTKPEVDELMKHLRRVEEGISLTKRMALLERRKGEVQMAGGQDEKALAHFQAALQLDEKVGVKRKAKKLEKELSSE